MLRAPTIANTDINRSTARLSVYDGFGVASADAAAHAHATNTDDDAEGPGDGDVEVMTNSESKLTLLGAAPSWCCIWIVTARASSLVVVSGSVVAVATLVAGAVHVSGEP